MKHKFNKNREFTGSFDMNHKRIYVGDLVEYCNIASIASQLFRSVVQKDGDAYTIMFEGGRGKLTSGEDTPYTINYGIASKNC